MACLLVIEGLLGAVIYRSNRLPSFFDVSSTNPIGYQLKPGRFEYWHRTRSVSVTVNGNDERIVPNAPDEAPTDVYLIGDSQVFGWGLNDDETLPFHVQRQLGNNYKVHNLGLPGAGPFWMLKVSATLDADSIPIYIFTEVNDGQGAYSASSFVDVHCGFLVRSQGLGSRIPCFILHSQLFGVIIDLRNLIQPNRLAPPLNCNPYADLAAETIDVRVGNILATLRERHASALFFTIPWDARVSGENLENYRPILNKVECGWSFPGLLYFPTDSHADDWFQNGDHHLNAHGAEYISTQIVTHGISDSAREPQ